VLCRKGVCKELSQDHKPENPEEEARIRKAGGHVAAMGPCYRVDGWGLNLSRARHLVPQRTSCARSPKRR